MHAHAHIGTDPNECNNCVSTQLEECLKHSSERMSSHKFPINRFEREETKTISTPTSVEWGSCILNLHMAHIGIFKTRVHQWEILKEGIC